VARRTGFKTSTHFVAAFHLQFQTAPVKYERIWEQAAVCPSNLT